MSQENLMQDIDNNFDVLNNNKSQCNFNINFNTNNKILRAFKTNNKIYIKPKHNFIKSFEREPSLDDKQKKDENNDKQNINDNKENVKSIRVKRDTTNMKINLDDNNIKDNKGINNDKIINSYRSNDNANENNSLINNQNRIKVCGLKSKYAKKKINNTFSILNKTNDETDKEKIIDKEKDKDKDKNDITQDNEDETTKSNINDNNISLNNLVFKKKNFRNNFYSNLDKKHNKNSSTVEKYNFDLSKNGLDIKNGVDTTRDDGKSYEESYDDTQNTVKSLPVNRSMRQFHSRYPRKMKRSKTNRRKINDERKKGKKEKNKYIRLKKEKSEILQSLKILLKKKEEIKNNEDKEEEESTEKKDNKNENDKNEDLLYDYKCIDNNSRKKIFVNKIRNEELNKIMIDETKKNRKGSLKTNNNNFSNSPYINEDDKKNDDDELNKRKICVRQNEELLQKGEKYSVRNKYKHKKKII